MGGLFDETPASTDETDQHSTGLLGKSTVRSSGSGSFKKRLVDIRSLLANKSRQQAGFDVDLYREDHRAIDGQKGILDDDGILELSQSGSDDSDEAKANRQKCLRGTDSTVRHSCDIGGNISNSSSRRASTHRHRGHMVDDGPGRIESSIEEPKQAACIGRDECSAGRANRESIRESSSREGSHRGSGIREGSMQEARESIRESNSREGSH